MYRDAINKVQKDLSLNHSLPSRPKSFGSEYEFPDNMDNLSSIILGSWLMKLAAWRGYTLRLLASAEMETTIIEDVIASKVSTEIAAALPLKLTKDQAIGSVLKRSENATIKSELIVKQGHVVALKRILEIYTTQFEAISREISRRSIESRLIHQGVNE